MHDNFAVDTGIGITYHPLVQEKLQDKILSEIRLQNIVFTGPQKLKDSGCVYIKGTFQKRSRNTLYLNRNDTADLFSYVNILNCRKWNRYCSTGNFSLNFDYQGVLKIRIFNNHNKVQKELCSYQTSGKGPCSIKIPAGKDLHILSFSAEAGSDAVIRSPGWHAELAKSPAPLKIAVVICTYRRMEYLKHTLDVLESALPENWLVITVDNDSSINDSFRKKYPDSFAFINNPNTGGAGGFSRGIIEAVKNSCAYAVLMDDDIELDPEALFRTDILLKYLKPQYRKFFLAGSMFRMDKPYIQHESTAVWDGIQVHSLRHNLDMTSAAGIIKNEKPCCRKNRFAGWWFCGIPLAPGIEEDLPFPMFVGGDDIEYSLRRAEGFLELNGICVWHEPFDAKYNPLRQHYLVTRNGLAVNALRGFSILKSFLLVSLRLGWQTLKKNPAARNYIRLGTADFLKGPGSYILQKNPFQIETGGKTRSQLFSLLVNYKKLAKEFVNLKSGEKLWDNINRRNK